MPRYTIRVCETRAYGNTYTVEADSSDEAVTKAEAGDTEEESTGSLQEVVDREAISTPELIS